MRAISLTQPWASLVAIGAKQWETRSWETAYRGEIAIHASKKYPKECVELEYEPIFLDALKRGTPTPHALPTASIIAVGTLTECRRSEEFFSPGSAGEASRRGVIIGPEEWAFGDYHEGRYAFRIAAVRALPKPVPCKGALGMWVVSDDVAAGVLMQLRDLQHEEAVRAEARGELS